eukprot:NODE_985_length_2539_cov_0.269262.p1 type:complete len:317 gc:universal NODE_985_length_2539_cov_0.269262:841-1791(+)
MINPAETHRMKQKFDFESSYVPIDEQDQIHQSSAGEATIFSSIINICNTILGSGMLLMPFAFAKVGWGVAIFLVILSASASALGMWLLTRVGVLYDKLLSNPDANFNGLNNLPPSFFSLAAITYPPLARFFDIAIGIKCLGVSVSYLIVIGQYMPVLMSLVTENSMLTSKTTWVLISLLIISPLAMKTRLDSLRTTSFIALIAVVYLVILVIYFFAIASRDGEIKGIPYKVFPPLTMANLDLVEFLKIFPAFVFAFTCHQNVLSVYNELENPTSPRLLRVIGVSIVCSALVYSIMGFLGYTLFGDQLSDNIVLMCI